MIFYMDGTDHTKGESCWCNPEKCNDCKGYIHFQGAYGTLIKQCDECETDYDS